MFDLQTFIASCRRFVGAPDGARRALDLMRTFMGDAESIKKAVAANEPGKAILDAPLFRSAELTILNVTLGPRFASPPHDHGMWAVVGIYEGQETNTFYRRSGEQLVEANRREIRAGDALLLGPDVIHAIANPLGSSTLGLHVYGGDLLAARRRMWKPGSYEELPFDTSRFSGWCAELTASRSARQDRPASE
jgi:predicted metal-dependent enzyme (double-stranded beta helix superfamily)